MLSLLLDVMHYLMFGKTCDVTDLCRWVTCNSLIIFSQLDQKGMEDQLVKAYGNAVTVSQNTQIR